MSDSAHVAMLRPPSFDSPARPSARDAKSKHPAPPDARAPASRSSDRLCPKPANSMSPVADVVGLPAAAAALSGARAEVSARGSPHKRELEHVPRTNTFFEDDDVAPKITGTLELPSTQEELAEGLAASALGSSKHYRLGYRGHPNEDRVFLRRTAWQEDGALVHALFVGVFDGHGGEGLASEFVCAALHENFMHLMAQPNLDARPRATRVSGNLERAFIKTDHDLYLKIKAEAAKCPSSKRKCRCKFFLEVPCVCLEPPIPANEGSTGTVLVVTSEDVFCANIGDSDAVLFCSAQGPVPPATEGGAAKRAKAPAPSHTSQLTVTDTPMVDEANEDYQRIRNVARARRVAHQILDAPLDGILASDKGSRFNYVSVPGARSLNMTRAFGNMGHKAMRDGELVEAESPIISRPHLRHVKRRDDMHCIVVGSDGLWDNLDLCEVVQVVDDQLAGAVTEQRVQDVAKDLLRLAVARKRKPDDICVAVIPLLPGGVVP